MTFLSVQSPPILDKDQGKLDLEPVSPREDDPHLPDAEEF